MKAVLKNIFRALMWMLFALILIGGVYGICSFLGMEHSTSLACTALVIAGILLFVGIRRILTRRNRRLQIQKIATLDGNLLANGTAHRIIDNRWKRAIAIMRTSHLGKAGNPIYALPWYMVMGKTGAGKSSAIGHCSINAMQSDLGPEDGVQSTRNCDWHFFQKAIVLDTAGRYAIPMDKTEDSAEWRSFLESLAQYRRKEPLNGLIITVAADTLYGSGEHLLEEARTLRRRIDEVMRVLGAKFPVYLMVSKLDLLTGMGSLLKDLTREQKKHALGILVQSPDGNDLQPVDVQIANALRDISARMRNFCLFGGDAAADSTAQPQRILAFEEFKAILPALRAYAGELFAANPYQENPFLRGIFFSSALRTLPAESRAFPHIGAFIKTLFATDESADGIFLHDFFGTILPADRNAYSPIAEYLRWRSATRLLAYSACLLLTLGISVLLCLAWQHNVTLINKIHSLDHYMLDTGITRRILSYETRFRYTTEIQAEIEKSLFPSMGFSHAKDAYVAYTQKLNTAFINDILEPATAKLAEQRNLASANTDDKEFFMLISDLIWRYDVLSAVDKGKKFDEILKIPAMPYSILHALGFDNIPQLNDALAYSVARCMYVIQNPHTREQMLRSIRSALAALPRIKTNSLQWIIHRAGTLSTLTPITGSEFWPDGRVRPMQEVTLNPIYTAEGMAVTLEYLDNLNLIIGDDASKKSTTEFLQWYANSFCQAWLTFASEFNKHAHGIAMWQANEASISYMATEDNPWFTLLLRMDEEIKAVRPYLTPVPEWVDDISVFARALRMMEKKEAKNIQQTLLQRLQGKAKSIYTSVADTMDSKERELDAKAQSLLKDMQAYLDALSGLVPATINNEASFTTVKYAMPDKNNERMAQSTLVIAKSAMDTLIGRLNADQPLDSPAYFLVSGPMDFFFQRTFNAASCHIQAMWEGEVLAKVGKLSPSQLQQSLFAEQGGLVRNYADNTLAYFFSKTINGYEAQRLFDRAVPFTDEFLSFLNTGFTTYEPVREEYGVTIQALPVDVNDGAAQVPHAVELALHCARERQTLTNYNSPASERFTWKKENCGDTSLSIRFNGITLEILYTGENGFLNFLNDFQYGTRTYHAEDFPTQEEVLKRMGISDITLRYTIVGAEDLLRSHSFTATKLPFVAAECKR